MNNSAIQATETEAPIEESRQTRLLPKPLSQSVKEAVEHYLLQADDFPINNLYAMVVAEVESSILEMVLKHTQGHQTEAATILGISRSTLRKKLKKYKFITI